MEYGLIGMPLGHSHSPLIHSHFGYGYELHPLEESALSEFFAKKNFRGINVTIPYKRAVMPYLNHIDELALDCNAVNTVVNKNGVLYGYNTDILGMGYAIALAGIELRDAAVVILGSGGTSGTARTLCNKLGAKSVTVVGRTSEINYDNVYSLTGTEVIINTTPVGMFPNNGVCPLELNRFPSLKGVFDAVYNPLQTRLVLEAKQLGLPATGGLRMLVAQAKHSAELFTDKPISDFLIEDITAELAASVGNVTLIGLPGCGKTTVGKLLADKLGFEFLDTDVLIEKAEGKSIPQIFSENGETYFRAVEKRIISDVTKRQRCVIATGGGAVLDIDNRFNLRQNGPCIRIERDINSLATDGRPLSATPEKLRVLIETREPLYRATADKTVKNIDPETAADEIVRYII